MRLLNIITRTTTIKILRKSGFSDTELHLLRVQFFSSLLACWSDWVQPVSTSPSEDSLFVVWVSGIDPLQDVDLQMGRLLVLLNVLYDLQGHSAPGSDKDTRVTGQKGGTKQGPRPQDVIVREHTCCGQYTELLCQRCLHPECLRSHL